MKRVFKSMLGVTLLEIMLVLAIAAMIIVMSIRYYQSASASQQANTFVEQVQAIAAAYDSLVQNAGGTGYAGVPTSALSALLPPGSYGTPWGGTIAINASTTTYSMAFEPAPNATCALLKGRFSQNKNYSFSGTCDGLEYNPTAS